jgi:hypothetical protein
MSTTAEKIVLYYGNFQQLRDEDDVPASRINAAQAVTADGTIVGKASRVNHVWFYNVEGDPSSHLVDDGGGTDDDYALDCMLREFKGAVGL